MGIAHRCRLGRFAGLFSVSGTSRNNHGALRVLPPLMLDRLDFLPADFICRDQRCKTYDEYECILADTDPTGISYVALAFQGERKAIGRLDGILKTLR